MDSNKIAGLAEKNGITLSDGSAPTAEERLEALEEAVLELILGGDDDD